MECKGDPSSGLVIVKSIDLVPGADPEELFWLTHDVERRAAWEKKSKFSNKSCALLEERVGGTVASGCHAPYTHHALSPRTTAMHGAYGCCKH